MKGSNLCDVGGCWPCSNSLYLFWSTFTPCLPTMNTRKYTSFIRKEQFSNFPNNLCCLRTLNNCSKWFICSPTSMLYTRMSSRYTTINLPRKGLNTSFISLIKVLGAPVNPNGITVYS